MKVEDIRNLNWVKLEETEEYKDWKNLPKRNIAGKLHVQSALIEVYLEEVYMQIARKLNISYRELSKMIKEENLAFYTLKKEMFQGKSLIEIEDGAWKLVKSYLMIPDVNSVPMIPKTDNKIGLKELIQYVSVLSNEEKKELAQILNQFKENNDGLSSEKIIEDFKQLSDLEKFQVLNSLKLLQIKIEFPTN